MRRLLRGLFSRPSRPPDRARLRARSRASRSQNRSSSAFGSLSVGSIISVPGTGSSSSARGSRSPSAAWRCRPPSTPALSLSPRGSTMHSCATRRCAETARVMPPRAVPRCSWRSGSRLRRLREPHAPHHLAVDPRDGQDATATPCAAAHSPAPAPGRARQERRKMRLHPDRPHSRPAAAVRDAEGLVQVEVADVGADSRRAAEADQRVHVRPVHVDLSAVLVHDLADLADRLLEDAVGGRIGDHAGREPVAAASASARKSWQSTLPSPPPAPGTTLIPASPRSPGWSRAPSGIRRTLRPVPRLPWYARIASRPAYSPGPRVRLQRQRGEPGHRQSLAQRSAKISG